MATDGKTRPWQEIAEEAAREKDPAKLLKLSEELNEALEQRKKLIERKPTPKSA